MDETHAVQPVLLIDRFLPLTEAASLRRFGRYWRLIGPFSQLVRWLALRQLVADLGDATTRARASSGAGPSGARLAAAPGRGDPGDRPIGGLHRPRDVSASTRAVPARAGLRRVGRVPGACPGHRRRPRGPWPALGYARRTVVVRTPYAGQQYFVGVAGESEWVRNVRAAAGHAMIRHGRATRVVLEEVPLAERAPILLAYLHRPGWSSPAHEARHYFGLPPDAAVEDFRPIVERYPVFRVTTPPGETPDREEDAHANHR